MADKSYNGLNKKQLISIIHKADFLSSIGVFLHIREDTLSKLTEMYKDCSVTLKNYKPPTKADKTVAITSGLAGVGLFAIVPFLPLAAVTGAIALSVGYNKFTAISSIGNTYARMVRGNTAYASTMSVITFDNIVVQKIKLHVCLLRTLLTFDNDKIMFFKVAKDEDVLPKLKVDSLLAIDSEVHAQVLDNMIEGVRGMVSLLESLADAPNIPALLEEFQRCSNEYFLEVCIKLENTIISLKTEYEEMRKYYNMLKGV
ncbi:uncharacterized protein LOC128242378 [Mya arenaria]|uniref:uncharacterized protein LOC128242378 n=1 Tax=Mya arenaria TaxID=6604 RepID=UPI0022E1B0EE|nr:uncharacterized protein LOC128242378 [Mya arenaria]